MKKRDYWEKHSAKRLLEDLKDAEEVVKALQGDYDAALDAIQKSIDALYGRFADENGVSKEDALAILSSKEFRHWKKTMESYLEATQGGGALALELNALCMRRRINRLEAIEGEIIANMAILADKQEKAAGEHLKSSLEKNYYTAMYDHYKDAHPKVLALMESRGVAINKDAVAVILTVPWAGSHYSKRIWKREYDIAHKVRDLMTRHILIGSDLNVVSKALAKELKLDSEKNVRRLLFTESAHIKGQADLMLYKELGIEEYEILATLDTKTSKICRSMDGKHFRVDEAQERVNYPPFHPNCRTNTIAYDDDKGGKTRAARDKDGKSYNVPLGMKYEEWYNTYVKNDPEYLAKEKAWKNRHGDKKQYDRYKQLWGKNVPNTFSDFQRLKYMEPQKYEAIKSGSRWIRSSFSTDKSLKGHYESHAHEFNNLSIVDYQKKAANVLSTPVSSYTLGYETDSRRVRYDVRENIFTLGNKKTHKITTMFKPKDGRRYYEREFKKDMGD